MNIFTGTIAYLLILALLYNSISKPMETEPIKKDKPKKKQIKKVPYESVKCSCGGFVRKDLDRCPFCMRRM